MLSDDLPEGIVITLGVAERIIVRIVIQRCDWVSAEWVISFVQIGERIAICWGLFRLGAVLTAGSFFRAILTITACPDVLAPCVQGLQQFGHLSMAAVGQADNDHFIVGKYLKVCNQRCISSCGNST